MTASYPLYEQYSGLWPLVAPLASYEEEMNQWLEILGRHFGERDLELLDLGTGGGHHLYHLCQGWPGRCEGVVVDRSPAMLARVEGLLPQFTTVAADMTTLAIERRFPLVVVHDSFCYLTDLAQVRALFATVAAHLHEGGLALVKVDALAGEFEGPYRYLTTFEDDEQEVTLTHYEWDPDPTDDWLEVVYLFLERRHKQVTSREERHRLGLFSREQLEQAFRSAGLDGRWKELDRWDPDRSNPVLVLTPTKVESHFSRKQSLS